MAIPCRFNATFFVGAALSVSALIVSPAPFAAEANAAGRPEIASEQFCRNGLTARRVLDKIQKQQFLRPPAATISADFEYVDRTRDYTYCTFRIIYKDMSGGYDFLSIYAYPNPASPGDLIIGNFD